MKFDGAGASQPFTGDAACSLPDLTFSAGAGVTAAAGCSGGAASFSAGHAGVVHPYNAAFNPLGSLTWAVWMRPTAGASGTRYLLRFGTAPGDKRVEGFTLTATVGGAVTWKLADGYAFVALAGGVADADTWTHVVATYDAASFTAALYVDGTEVASRAAAGAPYRPPSELASAELAVGMGFPAETDVEWVGELDDVALYYRALSAAEVGEQTCMAVGLERGLLATLGAAAPRHASI